MFHHRIRFKPIRFALAVFAFLMCLFSAASLPGALAHAEGESYLYFQISEAAVTTHVATPIQGLNEVLSLGLPTDKRLTRAEVEPVFDKIRTYVEQHVNVQCAPQNCELAFTGDTSLDNTSSGQFLQIYYDINGYETLPEALQVSYDVILAEQPYFTNFLLVDNNWKTGTFDEEANIVATIVRAGEIKTLDLTAGSILQGFLAIVGLGFEHILKGIDHVFFLVVLLLPSVVRRDQGKWQPVDKLSTSFVHILKIAIAFTVAHSITLGLATLQIVDLPSRLVESVIAFSIGLAALDIFYPIFRRRIWLVIFVFGLFHGFGLASVFGELGVTREYPLLSLLAFNLGVELGQLAIIAVVFPVLYVLRKQLFYSKFVLKAGGVCLGAMSLYWLIEGVFDVNIRVLPFVQGLFA